MRGAFALLACMSLVACSTDPGGDPLGGLDCDPLVPTQCAFPFPSNVYLVDDDSTVTKKRVQFRANSLPLVPPEYEPTDPSGWENSDGFSTGMSMLTHLPGATVEGLPTQDNLELSVTTASPTILLDAVTGELVPHFSELDMSIDIDDAERTFMIRPVVRLKDDHRYIVAIRRVVDEEGSPIEPSLTFKALRDGSRPPDGDPTVEPRRSLYKDIFAKLKAAGVEKNDLQIAWDFSTASRENNTRDMLHMRDHALSVVGEAGPQYRIVSVEDNPNSYIRKRIDGKVMAPLYLEEAKPGARIHRGEDGLPKQNGFAEYDFIVLIPNSVADSGVPAPILQQGHGLLGSRFEGIGGTLARFADEKGYVTLSLDLTGFAGADVPTAIEVLASDFSLFGKFVDPQHQGFINQLVAMRMMKGAFADDPEVMFEAEGQSFSAIDPSRAYYRGDSQGGIMGATYMAITTDIERGYLGVPGMPYNLLLNRSIDFDGYFVVLRSNYQGPSSSRDIQLLLGLAQMLWDRTEPNGYAPYISRDMLPGTPSHEVLLGVAIGDFQVTPLGAHIMARAIGAKNLVPAVRPIFGVEDAEGPFVGSAIVEFDYGVDRNPGLLVPKTNTPPRVTDATLAGPGACDPHGKTRNQAATFFQTDEFLRTGVVRQYCSGAKLRPEGDPNQDWSCRFDRLNGPQEPPTVPAACTPG